VVATFLCHKFAKTDNIANSNLYVTYQIVLKWLAMLVITSVHRITTRLAIGDTFDNSKFFAGTCYHWINKMDSKPHNEEVQLLQLLPCRAKLKDIHAFMVLTQENVHE